ncbi:hypothetical protein vseg_015831 [Gypsophila vaccaria]
MEIMKQLGMPYSTLLQCHDPVLGVSTLIPRAVTNNIRVFTIHTDIRMNVSQRQQSRVVYQSNTANTCTINNYNNSDELHVATCSGNVTRVQEVVNLKKELMWCMDSQGNIPLHVAIEKGHIEVAMYLVREFPKGSYALNHFEKSPIYLAVAKGYKNLVESMLEHLVGDSKVIDTLRKDKSIFAAITSKSLEMAQIMLKHQPKLIKSTNDEGWTPLSYAAYTGVVDIVDFILETCPGSVLKDSSYPIHKACLGGHVHVLQKFESHCTLKVMTKPDQNGLNILHHAARAPQNKLKHVVSYLLSSRFGRNLINMKDETNRTPYDLARYSQNHEVMLLLIEYRNF